MTKSNGASGDHTCGDAGGVTAKGNPCGRSTPRGETCTFHDPEFKDATGGHTCGDAGGTNQKGEPCGTLTSPGERCRYHSEQKHTCGDAGGVTAKGKPCRIQTTRGEMCARHDEEKEAEKAGPKPTELSEEEVAKLEGMAEAGSPLHRIAWALGIHDSTLRSIFVRDPSVLRRYKEAKARADAHLERTAYEMAVGKWDPEEEQWETPPDRTMLIFLHKVRLGYKEVQRTEVTGKDGQPMEQKVEVESGPIDPSKLSDEELTALDQLLQRAALSPN